jgi:nitroreductase
MSQIDIDRADTLVGEYDMLMELIRTRTSVRKLKPDPIPDDCVTKVLEAGRWAMSGANGQPWDFIVVKDAAIKKELFRAYSQENQEFISNERVIQFLHELRADTLPVYNRSFTGEANPGGRKP